MGLTVVAEDIGFQAPSKILLQNPFVSIAHPNHGDSEFPCLASKRIK